MIVQCAACQTRFKIADDKVTERGVKVKCTKCATTFVVRKDPPAPAPDSTPVGRGPAPAKLPEPPRPAPAPAAKPAPKPAAKAPAAALARPNPFAAFESAPQQSEPGADPFDLNAGDSLGVGHEPPPGSGGDPFGGIGALNSNPFKTSAPLDVFAGLGSSGQAPDQESSTSPGLFLEGLHRSRESDVPPTAASEQTVVRRIPQQFLEATKSGIMPAEPPPPPPPPAPPRPSGDPFAGMKLELEPELKKPEPRRPAPKDPFAASPGLDLGAAMSAPDFGPTQGDPFSGMNTAPPPPAPPPAPEAPPAAALPPQPSDPFGPGGDFESTQSGLDLGGDLHGGSAPGPSDPFGAPGAPTTPNPKPSPASQVESPFGTGGPTSPAPRAPSPARIGDPLIHPGSAAAARVAASTTAKPKRGFLSAVLNAMVFGLIGLAILAIAVVVQNDGNVPLKDLDANSAMQILFGHVKEDLLPIHVSNGLYDTVSGRPVFFVRGSIRNASAPSGTVKVTVELKSGSEVVRRADGWAGVLPTLEELHAISSPAGLAALNESLRARAVPLAQGAEADFLVVFYEYPDDLSEDRLRVHAEVASSQAAAPAPANGPEAAAAAPAPAVVKPAETPAPAPQAAPAPAPQAAPAPAPQAAPAPAPAVPAPAKAVPPPPPPGSEPAMNLKLNSGASLPKP